MAGFAVAEVSIPLAAIMLVAMFGVHWRYGYSSIRLKALSAAGAEFGPVGYELNLLYLAGLATVALAGAGTFSIDRLIRMKSKRPTDKLANAVAQLTADAESGAVVAGRSRQS
jgi:putative oxidoreductase